MSQNNADCTLRASSTIECSHTSYNDWVISLNKSLREAASSRGEEPPKDLERIVEALICSAQYSRDVNSKSEIVNLGQQALQWNRCPSCGTEDCKGTYAWSVHPVFSRCQQGHLTDITDPTGMTRFTKDGDRQLPDEITAHDLAMSLISARRPDALTSCPHPDCGMSSWGVQVGWEGVKGDEANKSNSMFGVKSLIN